MGWYIHHVNIPAVDVPSTRAFLRDIAAEMIREQIMLQLREEIPYSTAVQVQDFKERSNGTTYISANIIVERDSHKRIII